MMIFGYEPGHVSLVYLSLRREGPNLQSRSWRFIPVLYAMARLLELPRTTQMFSFSARDVIDYFGRQGQLMDGSGPYVDIIQVPRAKPNSLQESLSLVESFFLQNLLEPPPRARALISFSNRGYRSTFPCLSLNTKQPFSMPR